MLVTKLLSLNSLMLLEKNNNNNSLYQLLNKAHVICIPIMGPNLGWSFKFGQPELILGAWY